jgi:hypothetical protein
VSRPVASPLAVGQESGDDAAPSGQPESAAPVGRAASPLAVLSGALLVLGLGLFGLRWTARRLSDG